jgi:hypothetical protein
VLANERPQLGHELGASAEREIGVDPVLERDQPPLLQPLGLALRKRLVEDVCQRGATPKRERGAQRLGRFAGLALRKLCTSFHEEPFESVEVELVGLDVQHIAGGAPREAPVSEGLAQTRDVVVEGVRGRRRRPLAPQAVDQAVAGDDLVRVQQQDGEERTLLRTAEREITTVALHGDGAENRKHHDNLLSSLAARLRGFCDVPKRACAPSFSPRKERVMALRLRVLATGSLAIVTALSSALAGGPALGGQRGAAAARFASAGSLCVASKPGCFSTVQAAIDAAHDGDTIQIGAGTFAGGVTIDVSVRIVGAGAAATIIEGGGPVLTIGVPDAPSEPTVTIDGVTVTGGVTVGNLTPFNGRGGGIYIPRAEGPSTGATVTIRNGVIRGNTVAPAVAIDSGIPCPGGGECPFASAGGGGISNDGTLTLDHTLVSDNRADAASGLTSDADGGGILNRAFGNLTLKDSVVTDNRAEVTAPNGRFADGGGILMVAGNLTIDNSSVTGNSVDLSTSFPSEVETFASAGGIHVEPDAFATVRSTTITHNTVTASNLLGDAIDAGAGILTDGSLVLRGSTVSDNRVSATTAAVSPAGNAFADSGGLGTGCCQEVRPPSTVAISSTHFSGNSVSATAPAGTASATGGGINVANDKLVLVSDSLVGGNSVSATTTTGFAIAQGAGIHNGGLLTLRNATVRNNAGIGSGPDGIVQGGGIWNGTFGPDLPVQLTLADTLVTHNTLTASPGIIVEGAGLFTVFPVTLKNSVIEQNLPDDCSGC